MTTQHRDGRHDEGECLGVAPDGYRLTDTGNSQRFFDLAAGCVRYVHSWSKWIVYVDGRWNVDHSDALVIELAKGVSRRLMAMVPNLQGDERQRVFAAAVRAESVGALAAMVRLARGIPGVLVDHEELDANPAVLNVRNGIVDLRTGELRPHDPAQLCTMQAPVYYDPDAEAPLWVQCLERWQPDPKMREYLQLEAGAATTGHPTETVSIHQGDGSNGKSKYFGALTKTLGDYAVECHKSLLIASRHEQHDTVRASLFRTRLALASETGVSDRLSESAIKNVTGGDRLRARRMREDEWSFWPSHTLVLFSNYRPKVRGQDKGIWRRLRLIPWTVTIGEDEQDEHLADKLASQPSGILRWMVAGAVRYLKDGVTLPEPVVTATAGYRSAEDTVSRFIDETGIEFSGDPGVRMTASELSELHETWCKDAGIGAREVPSHWQRVAERLKREGARPARSNSVRYWCGIILKDPAQPTLDHVMGDRGDRVAGSPSRVCNSAVNGGPRHPRHSFDETPGPDPDSHDSVGDFTWLPDEFEEVDA